MTDLPSVAELARMIDHSLLHPTMTDRDLESGCALARTWGCASVCIKPYAVAMAARLLAGSPVAVGTVVGFPHGSSAVAIKVAETRQAIADGAREIDMVVNVGKVLSEDWAYVQDEIAAIQAAAAAGTAIVKVIFENDFLKDVHIERLCRICTTVGVAFVKTSTGYGYVKRADGHFTTLGATDPNLKLMRASAGPQVQVKAAGGVRTLDDLLRVRALGVTRAGATATTAILLEACKRLGQKPPAGVAPAATAGGY